MASLSCWHCFHHKENIDKEKAWRAQNMEVAENPVYKLVNIMQTGDLMKLYEDEGPEAVRKECIQNVSAYLYHRGRSSDVIKHKDYCRWMARMKDGQSTEPRKAEGLLEAAEEVETEVDYRKHELIRFTDHEACWDLEFRGAVGETALHLCYLNNTLLHLEIAKILLDLYPKLVLDIYEAEEYYGESALHFAVVHGNLESVKLLVEKGANVNQRATGRFFLPEDQKTTPKAAVTDYDGDAYYGEYPLAFAACLELESIYDYLISKGADPNLQDSFGNTVLHMVVIKDKPGMYSYAARHPLKKADHWKKNFLRTEHTVDGLTPLALANRLGRHQVFSEIMELQKMELWRFSNVHCSIYPILAVDTIGPNGGMNWNSSLMITLDQQTEQHKDMLQSGVLRQLLDEKWKTFVRKRFFLRLCFLIFHLIMLTASVWLRPSSEVQLLQTRNDKARLATEICTVIACVVVLFLHAQEMRFLGVYSSFANLANAPFKALYLIGCILQLAVVPVRLASIPHLSNKDIIFKLRQAEETLLILALPLTWTMILFFAKVTFHIGPLINIFFIYIKRDLLPFLTIVVVMYIGFAISFYRMYKTIDDSSVKTFESVLGAVTSLVHFTFGEFEYDEFKKTEYPLLTMIVFILFMLIMPILLINMLIAMMASTFDKIIIKSEKDWIHQWAKIVIMLEQTFSNEDLLKFQQKYSVKIENPLDIHKGLYPEPVEGKIDFRGIMVIKTATKTKSKQRKDAVRNWKRTVKEVLSRIKELKARHPYNSNLEIDFHAIFSESEDGQVGSRHVPHRRLARVNMFGSQDLAAAVEQLTEAMVPRRSLLN